jgi:hypothetical protein
VFSGGHFIGGCDDTLELLAAGRAPGRLAGLARQLRPAGAAAALQVPHDAFAPLP